MARTRLLATTPRAGEMFSCPVNQCNEVVKPSYIGRSFMLPDTTEVSDIFICVCKNCGAKFVKTLRIADVT
jgi:hypothetical protein